MARRTLSHGQHPKRPRTNPCFVTSRGPRTSVPTSLGVPSNDFLLAISVIVRKARSPERVAPDRSVRVAMPGATAPEVLSSVKFVWPYHFCDHHGCDPWMAKSWFILWMRDMRHETCDFLHRHTHGSMHVHLHGRLASDTCRMA